MFNFKILLIMVINISIIHNWKSLSFYINIKVFEMVGNKIGNFFEVSLYFEVSSAFSLSLILLF